MTATISRDRTDVHTRTLARFTAQLSYDQLPDTVRNHLKSCVLDALGCVLFGSSLPWTKRVIDMVQDEGGSPRSRIIGTPLRTSASLAALVNGTAGHAFEIDDMHRLSLFHPGSIAIPVALALGDADPTLDGRKLASAIVAGYEVGTRVGMAGTTALFFRGYHPQGTSGVFTAGATAASALGLNPEQAQDALGIVGSQGCGLMAAQEGAMVKRFHSGRAAQSGVYAGLLAKRGFTGIPDVLEAEYGGFLSTISGAPDRDKLTDGLGEKWEILETGFKPHSTVASIHTSLDALAEIMKENGLSADDIERVDVGVAKLTHVHCAWRYAAQGVTAAQMNLLYSLAVVALDGEAFVDQYLEERLADPAIFAFIERIHAYPDEKIEGLGPNYRHGVRMTVTTRDGRTFFKENLNARRGSPENPIGWSGVEAKFRNLAGRVVSPSQVDRIVEAVQAFETLPNAAALTDLFVPSRAEGR